MERAERRRRIPSGPFAPIWVATVALFAVSPLLASGSLGSSALKAMVPFAAILVIAAIGQTLVVQQRGLDLSVPGTMSLSAALITQIPGGDAGKLPLAIVVVALAAAAIGLIIGLAVTRLGVTPLVATLAVNALALGTVVKITGGSIANSVPKSLASFADRTVLGVSSLGIIALLAVAAVALVMRRTLVGRRLELVGANPRSARVAGIPVARYQVATYVAASLCYAVAGVLLAALTSAPSLFSGNPYLLPTIAAVVLGGTSLGGGRASVVATAVGAVFLTQLDQLVLSTGADNAVQSLIQGAIVALGMGLRNVPWRRIVPTRGGRIGSTEVATSESPGPMPVEPTRGA
jgi:ribose transport system permease protein